MLGPGRPAKRPSIDSVRELTREEVASMPKARAPAVVQLRDTHHALARLVALGLRNPDISARTGYSLVRISIMKGDPAFQELVASYRDSVDESWRQSTDEYFESASAVRVTSMRLIRDRLETNGDKIPLGQLVAIHADTADRTGYPKRKESVNLNVDFAARLEQAVRRSNEVKTIDGSLAAADGVPAQQKAVGKAGGPHAAFDIIDDVGPVPDKAWGPTNPKAPNGSALDPLQPHPDGAVAGAVAQEKSLDTPTPAPLSLAAEYLPSPRERRA